MKVLTYCFTSRFTSRISSSFTSRFLSNFDARAAFRAALSVGVAAMLMMSSSIVSAATEANEYFIKVDVTGSRIPVKLIKSNIPFDKHYNDFNDVDKASYRAYYEKIPAENVPPFPRNGLGQVSEDVKDAHVKMQKTGPLFVVAKIDESGKIETVSVFESPDERMTQLVSAALWEEEFVPGSCAGKPCTMEFVLDWELMPVRGSAVVDSDKKSRSSRKRSD